MDDVTYGKLRDWFSGYCRSFYTDCEEDNRNYRLKEEHTGRVCDAMEVLAEGLGLGESDRLLAGAVALFHDLGRFEQYRQYRTFKDSDSINHAALSARVLAEQGVLAHLPAQERQLITSSVALHNVFRIPAGLPERGLLFLKLIRDADKLDIWRVFIEFYGQAEEERASAVGLGFSDLPDCSPEVVASLQRGQMVNLATVRSLNDFKLLQLSWVYDLNFPGSFRLVRERRYLEEMEATLPDDRGVRQAVACVTRYLSSNLPV